MIRLNGFYKKLAQAAINAALPQIKDQLKAGLDAYLSPAKDNLSTEINAVLKEFLSGYIDQLTIKV